MNKREFLKTLIVGGIGITCAALLGGCIAPRISYTAGDKAAGKPFRCEKCGHLTRSKTDITGDRCPRCRARMLRRITEAEMANYLANQ